jgi:hypothetical protein
MEARRKRRIVLFPYGQPARDDHRDRCSEIFLSLGGDVHRIIDGPFASLDRFVAYVRRIQVIHDGSEWPIVMLTNANPLALMVINARRKLEHVMPALSGATWVLFIDSETDPFFTRTAQSMGAFEHDRSGVLHWKGPDDALFMVTTADGHPLDTRRSIGVGPRSDRPTPEGRKVTARGIPPPDTIPPRR